MFTTVIQNRSGSVAYAISGMQFNLFSIFSTLTGSYNFESDENYYIEVRSFDIKGARNHTLLTIKSPSAAVPGTGFSLVRHKPGM